MKMAEAQWRTTVKALLGDVHALEMQVRYEMRVVRPSLFGRIMEIEDR